MDERGRKKAGRDPRAPEPPARGRDPLAWLRDGPTLIRRMVMAEILGPPRALSRRRRVRG